MGFNPPPGWPVPQGWEPPQNWVPDPSWPPAPAGWQFWTDVSTATSRAAQSLPSTVGPPRNLKPLAFGAAALVLAAAAVGVGLLLSNSRDRSQEKETATREVEGQSVTSVPGVPSAPESGYAAPCATEATDVLGDTDLMYDERGEYNRSDIVSLRVNCASDQLTVSMTFASGVDMTVAGFAAMIDRDPEAGTRGGHSCDGDSTEDFSISVDGAATGNSWSLLDATSCGKSYPVVASGPSATAGSTMTASVPFADLGIARGDTITLRAFSSTFLPPNLLDPGQDDIPDGPPLRIRIE